MIKRRPNFIFWMVGVSALAATCVTWLTQPTFSRLTYLLQKGPHAQIAQASQLMATPKKIAPSIEDIHILSVITSKIAYMLTVDESVRSKVWPDTTTDPKGRRGIFIASSHPLRLDFNEPGMDVRKSWVLLAVLASVKYTEGSIVDVDYIAFTDPQGLSRERWFYELEMSAARHVHHEILLGNITMQQGYDHICATWHRVTSEVED